MFLEPNTLMRFFKTIYKIRYVNYAALERMLRTFHKKLKSVKWAGPLWRSSSSWLRRLNKCFLGTLQFLTHFSLEYLLEA